MYYKRDVEQLHLSKEQAYRNTYEIRKKRWMRDLTVIKSFCNDNDIDVIILKKGEFFSNAVQMLENEMAEHRELNERRHIAAYNYLKEIDDIMRWIEGKVKNDYALDST